MTDTLLGLPLPDGGLESELSAGLAQVEAGLQEAEPVVPSGEAPERPKGRRLSTRAKDVVQGMIWHEILKKPKGL